MKKKTNEIKLVFPSVSENENFARTAVAAFAAQLDPTLEELADIRTAVSEAVTNCIVHAYRNGNGNIFLHCVLFDEGSIRIKIRDLGCGIDDVQKAMQPLYSTAGEERAGLGFAVMQTFMDKLRVKSTVGKGTTVTMEKKVFGKMAAENECA
jgi:stage II sporulation protein AB (anti-sigma F factor)